MLRSILALVFISLCSHIHAQQARLIVRGDDMGYSHSGNEAIIKSFKEGIESSIEIIVPSPWFPEAARLLNEYPQIDVGIHLAITSEWDNIKWRPLSECPSIVNADGYFFPMLFPNKNYPGQSVSENQWKIEDIEKEFRAQIELALKKIPRISHISSHMGCTDLAPAVKAMTKRLAKEYKIDIDLSEYQVEYVAMEGARKTSEEKIQSFMKMLDKLQPGKNYLFVEHPGFDNAELRAVSHIGYENVAEDRQGVTDLFTNDKVKEMIRKKGILLIGYKDLLTGKK